MSAPNDLQAPAAWTHTAGRPFDGDIILFRAGKDNRAVKAQRARHLLKGMAGWRDVDIAHVALTASSGGYIHAMPERGVHTSTWAELRGREDEIIVLRRAEASAVSEAVLRGAVEHLGKKYNAVFDAKGLPILKERFADHLFCSELIDQFYTREQLGLTAAKSFLHPNDLKGLLDNPDWIDVTDIYLPYVRGEVPDTGGTRVLEALATTSETLRAGREFLARQGVVNGQLDELKRTMEAKAEAARRASDQLMAAQLRRRRLLRRVSRILPFVRPPE